MENQVPLSAPQSPAPVPAPKSSKKQAVILMVVGLVLIAATTPFLYQKYFAPQEPTEALTVSEFSDWKTYRNEEYGFEMKYPYDWEFSEEANKVGFYEIESIERPGIWINMSKDGVQYVSKKIIDRVDDFLKPHIKEGKVNFAGVEADFITHGTAIGGSSHNIIFTINNITFWIEYGDDLNLDKEIVSTFKFISTSASEIDISNWIPAGGDALGFSLLVPPTTKISNTYNKLTGPHADFTIENSTQDQSDYFYLIQSNNRNFGIDDSWTETSLNIGGIETTVLMQKTEKLNRILFTYKERKWHAIGYKSSGWELLLKVLETLK